MTVVRPPLPHYIDSSMLVAFRACPRKFFYEYLECLRPRGRSVDLVAGGAFAAGLEETYQAFYRNGGKLPEALEEGWRAFSAHWGDFDPPISTAKTFERTFGALIDYFETYPPAFDQVQPLQWRDGSPTFEFSFSEPLDLPDFPLHPSGDPFLYVGRFDAFGQMGDKLVIRDEKTMGRKPSAGWSESFDLRNQFLGYIWGAQRHGFKVNTVVVRGVSILKTLYHQTEAIKIVPDFMLDRFLEQLRRDLTRLLSAWESGYFDYNLGDSCSSFSGCAYHLLCSQPEPEKWYSDFERVRWNPITRNLDPRSETLEGNLI